MVYGVEQFTGRTVPHCNTIIVYPSWRCSRQSFRPTALLIPEQHASHGWYIDNDIPPDSDGTVELIVIRMKIDTSSK